MTPKHIILADFCGRDVKPFYVGQEIKSWFYVDDSTGLFKTWDPWADISQAIEVVEKMREKGYYFSMHTPTPVSDDKKKYYADFFLKNTFGRIGKTPSAAICEAAVEAVENET